MELELRHLRVVVALADSGSVSKAAAALGVSQPSLTAQLQRIERTVGGQLFERTPTGVLPTALGTYVISSARAVLTHMAHLHAGSDALRPDVRMRLRLGTVPGPLLAGLVPRLRELLPGCEVTSQVEPSSRVLLHLLETGRLDAAVVREFPGFGLRFPADVQHRTLVATEPLFVALAETHPLARGGSVSLSDLAEEEWIHEPPDDSGLYVYFRSACEAAGFTPMCRHVVAESTTARGFVVSRQAVSLAQPTSREFDGLVVRPLTGDPLHRHLILAWRRNCPLASRADDMFQCAVDAYLELVERNKSYVSWWAEHPEVHPEPL